MTSNQLSQSSIPIDAHPNLTSFNIIPNDIRNSPCTPSHRPTTTNVIQKVISFHLFRQQPALNTSFAIAHPIAIIQSHPIHALSSRTSTSIYNRTFDSHGPPSVPLLCTHVHLLSFFSVHKVLLCTMVTLRFSKSLQAVD